MNSRKERRKRGRGDQRCVVLRDVREEEVDSSEDEFFSCVTSEAGESVTYFSSEEDFSCSCNGSILTPELQPLYFVGDPKAVMEDANALLKFAHSHPDDRMGYIESINQLKLHMDSSSGILRVRSDFERALGVDTCRGMLTLLAVTSFNMGLLEDADMASRSLVHLYPDFDLGQRIFKCIHEEASTQDTIPNISPVLKSCLKAKPSPSPGKKVSFSRTKSVRMFEKEEISKHFDYIETEELPDDHDQSPVKKKISSGWVPPSVRRKRLAEEQKAAMCHEEDTIETSCNPNGYISSGIKELTNYQGSLKCLERVPSDTSDASSIEPRVSIFEAAFDGNCDKVVECIESGCYSVNDKDADGKTALMIAAVHGNHEVLTTLMERYHANADMRDRNGKTATMLAAADGRMDILKLLREYSQG